MTRTVFGFYSAVALIFFATVGLLSLRGSWLDSMPKSVLKANLLVRSYIGDAKATRTYASLIEGELHGDYTAKSWWIKAANMGDGVAQLNLAKESFYIMHDKNAARYWAFLASRNDDAEIAKAAKEIIEKTQ